ncbi:PQQ-dependent sugar dehydrogenase [Antrihabitans spumae]|uniref:PQQ-dependent sugar dehydrogenase n=1 Tax=Antrihabitans spumae TaxID=3373370 RepID=A0ABW7JWP1_9NOCA
MRRSILVVVCAQVFALVVALCHTSVASAQPAPPLPALLITTAITGLKKPWDVAQAPDGAVITGERGGRFVVKRPDGSVEQLAADLTDLYVEGETGLMGLTLAPDFSSTRTLLTCQGHRDAAGTDIRVVAWTVDVGWTTLTRGATVLAGIPVGPEGRHDGCRVLAAADGTLYVGTGDAASPSVPQDPNSFGGKVLHINADGSPAAGNPDPRSPVFTRGHRNPQGLAVQPGTRRIYAIEQGTDRDDEVNLLQSGGNYGYSPDLIPFFYNETVPMTDPIRVPGAIPAVWSSGAPTLATPGGTFVAGSGWGEWEGALAIPTQQGKKMVFLKLAEDGRSVVHTAVALENQFGRLRSATATADGSLLITTDNGKDDQVLLLTPRS